MSDIRTYKILRGEGQRLGREGLSSRVIDLVNSFDGTYVGAMVLAGRLKAIAQAAGFDDYWTEKVQNGYWSEQLGMLKLQPPPKKIQGDPQ